jgi:hypothetical protein
MKTKPKIKTGQNKTNLASGIGISRTTLDKYLAIDGAPVAENGKYDPAKVVEWIKANADHESVSERADPEIRKLKKRELTSKCERLEFKLAQDRGEFIAWSKIGPALDNAHTAMRAELQRKLEQELGPKLPFMRPEDQMAELRTTVDSLCETFNKSLSVWYQAKTN